MSFKIQNKQAKAIELLPDSDVKAVTGGNLWVDVHGDHSPDWYKSMQELERFRKNGY